MRKEYSVDYREPIVGIRTYIAGPLTTDQYGNTVSEWETERNIEKAMDAAEIVVEKGHWPFIPHLNYYYTKYRRSRDKTLYEPRKYLLWDFSYLDTCPWIVILGQSSGSDIEELRSRFFDKVIFTDPNYLPRVEEYYEQLLYKDV